MDLTVSLYASMRISPKFRTKTLPNRGPFETRAKTQHFYSPPSFDSLVFQNEPLPSYNVQVMNFFILGSHKKNTFAHYDDDDRTIDDEDRSVDDDNRNLDDEDEKKKVKKGQARWRIHLHF